MAQRLTAVASPLSSDLRTDGAQDQIAFGYQSYRLVFDLIDGGCGRLDPKRCRRKLSVRPRLLERGRPPGEVIESDLEADIGQRVDRHSIRRRRLRPPEG